MDLVNATKLKAAYTVVLDPDGRERLVVVAKGTFAIPVSDVEAPLADEQADLVLADEFEGEPGKSAVRYESDFAPVKPRCDVLLNGSAYAERGRPAQMVQVGLRVGAMSKGLGVYGPRCWVSRLFGIAPTEPQPFVRALFGYGTAFGGEDADPDDLEKVAAYRENPVGTGFFPHTKGSELVGRLAPNTAEVSRPVKSTTGAYRPMALGAVGRNFAHRIALAGTYDEAWLEDTFPFLPPNFDPRYFQAAPPEQQIDYPRGGEPVAMLNLTPSGRADFRLPRLELPVEFSALDGRRSEQRAVPDTILLEPDLGRMLITWRASLPLRRDIMEMAEVIVGKQTRAFHLARATGKRYVPSLDAYIREKREEQDPAAQDEPAEDGDQGFFQSLGIDPEEG